MAGFVPLQKMNDYGSDKSDIGKMDSGAKTSPPFRQISADDPRYGNL